MKYKPRIYDKILREKLEEKGAILIEGPKWCGKTTTGEQFAQSILYLADPRVEAQYLMLADIDPAQLLMGKAPRLIDEWQIAPKLWDAVRYEVDHRENLGQFILTGSAVPPSYEKIHHTGTGRFAWIKMRPMSLYESQDSTGEISLEYLFSKPELIRGENHTDIQKMAFLVCRGGWPKAVGMKEKAALAQAYDYIEAVIHSDISRVDNITRNPEKAAQLLRSYARNVGTQISISQIVKDINVEESDSLALSTANDYINALKKIFVIEEMDAWNPNLRSKTAIRSANTRYFVDPSIAVAALNVGPNDLISDLQTFGFLFESLCIRDLRIYADSLNGKVYHYRDKNGLECDAVIHLRNGEYGLIEIKLGGEKLISEGAANLKRLADRLDYTRMKKPAFLMVLVGTDPYAYRRPDGVYVVPVSCLKD